MNNGGHGPATFSQSKGYAYEKEYNEEQENKGKENRKFLHEKFQLNGRLFGLPILSIVKAKGIIQNFVGK